jgi:hypothetical protein
MAEETLTSDEGCSIGFLAVPAIREAFKMLWGLAAARLDILQVDQNLVRSIR